MKTVPVLFKCLILIILSLSFILPVRAENVKMTADQIIEKTKSNYDSLKTFKAHGTITMEMGDQKVNTDFNILLYKPNQYLISWVQKRLASRPTQSGAVWNSGTQPYLYMGMMNSYFKMSTDEMALAGATGISSGAASTMPSIFLSVFKPSVATFDRLINPTLEKVENIQGEDCYVISGSSKVSPHEILWISTSRFLIIKYSRSLGGALSTENFFDISFPQVNETDFQYQVPEGTILKDLGTIFKYLK